MEEEQMRIDQWILALSLMVTAGLFVVGCASGDDESSSTLECQRSGEICDAPNTEGIKCCPLGGGCGSLSPGGSFDPDEQSVSQCANLSSEQASGPPVEDEHGCFEYTDTSSCTPSDPLPAFAEGYQPRTAGFDLEEMEACQNDAEPCPAQLVPGAFCCPLGGDCGQRNLGGGYIEAETGPVCESVSDAGPIERLRFDPLGCAEADLLASGCFVGE